MRLLREISDALKQRSRVRDTELMIDGDHWLEGRGWVGPKFKEGSDGAEVALQEIQRQFVSKNTINEVCKRHRDSVTGQEPQWSFSTMRVMESEEEPTGEEQALIDEANSLITQWFDGREIQREFQDAVKTLLWAKISGNKSVSPLRLYLPAIELEEDGTLPDGLDDRELIRKICLRRISPTQCGMVVDTHNNDVAGFYRYMERDIHDQELNILEIHVLAKYLVRYDPEFVKLVNEFGLQYKLTDTLILKVRDLGETSGEILDAVAYPLGGRLLIYEMAREPLLAESSISMQKQLNLALTLMSHNVVQGGFLERTIMNGQRPGHWVDKAGKRVPEGQEDADSTFVPEALAVGAGSTQFIMGEPIYDPETGEITGYTTPSLLYRDPVPVTTFKETATEARHGIYEEAHQIHVLISGDATSSGTARQQAANDFVGSLTLSGKEVEVTFRWMLDTVLKWFAVMRGEPEKFDSIKAVVTPRYTAVQPTSEELRLVIEQLNAGILSLETAMSRSGIEDTAAELDRIQEDMDRALDREKERRLTLPGELDPEDREDVPPVNDAGE